ncbi:MAG: glycosyltransferase [Devosia sp.]|uniref:glycosyltransferase n=1 Tax=Devosia sp. TaxID=1871048 RepID=UPI0024CC990B|nr:glycosyltransferase [Devosia sp.]UYO01225.1 MAG: glycosyltransferase [Devosia sp.]
MVEAMPVYFVLPSLSGGGAERVITTLLRFIDRKRFDPTLVLVNGADRTLAAQVPEDVRVIDLGEPRLRNAMPALLRLIWRDRPPLVVSTLDHVNVATGLLRMVFPRGTRLIVRVTDFLNLEKPGLRRMMALSFPRADGIIFQSRAMEDAFSERLGLARGVGQAIANPVDIEGIRARSAEPVTLPFRPERTNLVAVGRLAPAKGFDTLLAALARSPRSDVDLHILGEGSERAALEGQIADLGLADRVRLAGFTANPYSVMAKADGFVLSSRFEGFPNVVLEALCCGLPVLSTPVPGVAELIGSVPGCVLAKGFGADDLAAALADFATGNGQHPSAGVVDGHSAANVTRAYEDYFIKTVRQGAV